MYTIYNLASGRFECEGRLQDGTERWQCDSLVEAIRSMKKFALAANHTKIKTKDIRFLRPEKFSDVRWVPWKPT